LLAGRALDAGGDIDAGRRGDTQRLYDVESVQAAREHERRAGLEILEQPPVEALAKPARPRRLELGARVEDQAIRDGIVEADRREVRALGDWQRLHHRQSETLAHHDDAFRRLPAVKLQQIGLERCDAPRKLIVAGVDRKRDLLRPATHALAERTRGLDANVTRRWRKEDEADQIGTGFERHIERLERLQAADFDQNGHGRDRSPARFYIGAGVLSRLSSPLILKGNSRSYAAGGGIISRGAASPEAGWAASAVGPSRRLRRSTSARS